MAAVVVLCAAIGVTVQLSDLLVIMGLVPWAQYGAWLGLIAGILGLITWVATIRAHRAYPLPLGSMAGFLLTGLAAISLSLFLWAWDLGPF